MSLPPSEHLTPADVEAWLEGRLPLSSSTHVGRCDDCRSLLLAEKSTVELLHQLPRWAPSEGFADKVMAQVRLPAQAVVAVPVKSARGRWAAAAGVSVMLALSVIWSLANRELLTDVSEWIVGGGWDAARSFASEARALLFNLPAAREIQVAVGTPLRLAAVASAILVLYGTGIVALRRLLALPAVGAAHAGR